MKFRNISVALIGVFVLTNFTYYSFRPNNIIIRNIHNEIYVSAKRIPSLVHFVLGQNDSENLQLPYPRSSHFSFINYLIFLAARRQLQPKINIEIEYF